MNYTKIEDSLDAKFTELVNGKYVFVKEYTTKGTKFIYTWKFTFNEITNFNFALENDVKANTVLESSEDTIHRLTRRHLTK